MLYFAGLPAAVRLNMIMRRALCFLSYVHAPGLKLCDYFGPVKTGVKPNRAYKIIIIFLNKQLFYCTIGADGSFFADFPPTVLFTGKITADFSQF